MYTYILHIIYDNFDNANDDIIMTIYDIASNVTNR